MQLWSNVFPKCFKRWSEDSKWCLKTVFIKESILNSQESLKIWIEFNNKSCKWNFRLKVCPEKILFEIVFKRCILHRVPRAFYQGCIYFSIVLYSRLAVRNLSSFNWLLLFDFVEIYKMFYSHRFCEMFRQEPSPTSISFI